jgi:hypothetical protein
MNHYGTQAQNHWRNYLPESYAQISDPATFFTELGERAETQIVDLQVQLAGEDIPGEGYLGKVGRLNNAKMRAEEIVLREEVLIAPEKTTYYDPELDLDVEEPEESEATRGDGWIVIDPNKVIDEVEEESRRFVP